MANISEARPIAGGRATEQRRLNRKTVQSVLSHAVLITLSLVFLTPFLWLLTTSVKPDTQIFAFPPVWIPSPVTFQNYVTGLQFIPFMQYLSNTLIYCGLSIVGTIISSSLVAYSLTHIEWPGRTVLFLIIVATMMVPGQVTMIPLFLVFKTLGWLDSLKPLIVPHFFVQPFFIFLLRQFFLTIPRALDEAARIDGASEWQIFSRIIVPLSTPALGVLAIFSFNRYWNSFLWPLVVARSADLYTLQVGLSFVHTSEFKTEYGLMMAGAAVASLPMIVVFFAFQRYFMQGIRVGAVKG